MRNAITILGSMLSGAAIYKRYLMEDYVAVMFLLVMIALLIIVGVLAETKK